MLYLPSFCKEHFLCPFLANETEAHGVWTLWLPLHDRATVPPTHLLCPGEQTDPVVLVQMAARCYMVFIFASSLLPRRSLRTSVLLFFMLYFPHESGNSWDYLAQSTLSHSPPFCHPSIPSGAYSIVDCIDDDKEGAMVLTLNG